MSKISLGHATTIINAALAKAEELGLNKLGVAVVDRGGHLISFARQDGASTGRYAIAFAKATGALFIGVSSRSVGDLAEARPMFFTGVSRIAPSGLVPTAGGVIIVDSEGSSIGAVGISGDTPDNDEACALTGIAAAGLSAQA